MVAAYLAAQGYEIFLPASPHARSDMVYVYQNRAIRVQVKTATWHSYAAGKVEQCRLVAGWKAAPYTKEDIDEFWIVGTHLWRIPIEDVEGMTSIFLNSTNPKPRKSVRSYDPNNYIVVRGNLENMYRDRLTRDVLEPHITITNSTYSPDSEGGRIAKRLLKQKEI